MGDAKVWMITGASRGMGVAFTKAALDAGHAVVATGRRPQEITALIGQLDAIGFDYGKTHVSVWRALVALAVGLLIFIAAMLASRVMRRLFRRISRLDQSQRLVGEKLLGVAVWMVAILVGADVREFEQLTDEKTVIENVRTANALLDKIEKLPVPVVSILRAINAAKP